MESQGKKVFFVSNNASKTPADAVKRMKTMDYADPKVEQVIMSSLVAAKWVRKYLPDVKKVFIVGEKSMRETFEAEGIVVLGAD